MEDKDILLQVIDGLGVRSVNSFSKEIGYSSPSALYLVLSGERSISEHLIRKIKDRYPKVNEVFLRGKSDEVLVESNVVDEKGKDYTLNDLPGIMIKLLKEQQRTNELLIKYLNK